MDELRLSRVHAFWFPAVLYATFAMASPTTLSGVEVRSQVKKHSKHTSFFSGSTCIDEVEEIDERARQMSKQATLLLLHRIMSYRRAVGRQQHTILACSTAS
jgi:hypothetical protein